MVCLHSLLLSPLPLLWSQILEKCVNLCPKLSEIHIGTLFSRRLPNWIVYQNRQNLLISSKFWPGPLQFFLFLFVGGRKLDISFSIRNSTSPTRDLWQNRDVGVLNAFWSTETCTQYTDDIGRDRNKSRCQLVVADQVVRGGVGDKSHRAPHIRNSRLSPLFSLTQVWVFLERAQILSRFQVTRHLIKFVFVEQNDESGVIYLYKTFLPTYSLPAGSKRWALTFHFSVRMYYMFPISQHVRESHLYLNTSC